MRLIRHLNEAKQAIADEYPADKYGNPLRPKSGPQVKIKAVKEWMAIIEKPCSQIIKEYKKADEFFYRGTFGRDFIEKSGRITKVRPPKDTPVEVHRFINKIFKETFGWKVRDGVPTTPNANTAQTYGTPYLFFPVNGYKYVWSRKVKDLYIHLPVDLKRLYMRSIKLKKDRDAHVRKFEKLIRIFINLYQDTGIQQALMHDNEVMFRTKKWYGIHERFENQVAQYIGMEH
jgi:hypothetical protein